MPTQLNHQEREALATVLLTADAASYGGELSQPEEMWDFNMADTELHQPKEHLTHATEYLKNIKN